MSIYSIEDLRATAPQQLKNAPDSELISEYSRSIGAKPEEVASYLGYGQKGGLTRSRLAAGVDSYQANLYGVGESVAGALGADKVAAGMRRGRQGNELDASLSRARAKDQGAVDNWRDVQGPGSLFNFAGGLAADSLPYVIEAGAGGLAGRAVAGGLRLASGAAKAAPLVGAAAASYPSAVGDILQNQREQAGGQTDLGSALVGGVPYAALNVVGLEGAAARGAMFRNSVNVLDRGTGLRGGLARAGATALTVGAKEGASETGQEFVNQYFGRMAVDPNEAFMSPAAQTRYADSFVGGAVLGGGVGAAAGGWRRSEGYGAPISETGTTDLLAPAQPVSTPYNLVTQPSPLQGRIDQNLGIQRTGAPKDYAAQFAAAAAEPSGQYGTDPATGQERALDMGQYFGAVADPVDAGVSSAVPPAPVAPSPEMERVEAVKAAATAKAQEIIDRDARAQEFGLKGNAAFETYGQLEAALDSELINDAQFAENVGLLAARKYGQVKKYLEGMAATKQAAEAPDATTQAVQDSLGRIQERAAKAPSAAPDTGAAPVRPGAEPVSGGSVADIQPADLPVAEPDAALTAQGEPTVQIGRSDRRQTVTREQLYNKLKSAPPKTKRRMLQAMGYELTENPDTGAPMLVQAGSPRSFAEVAAMEAESTGAPVSRQAIAQSLAAFGITEDVIDRVAGAAAPEAVSAEDLGLAGEGGQEAAGMRVEDTVSKAAGAGLVEGTKETAEQRKLRVQADSLLEEAGPSTAVGASDDVPPTNLPAGAVVTDLRDRNAEIVARNIDRLLADIEAQNAAADWDNDVVAFTELPPTMQADWIAAYKAQLERGEGDISDRGFQELAREQARIEDTYGKIRSRDSRSRTQSVEGAGFRTDQGSDQRRLGGSAIWKTSQSANAGRPRRSETGVGAGAAAQGGSTAADITAELKQFMRTASLGRNVNVVQSVQALPPSVRRSVSPTEFTQGFVVDGKAFLIADNIEPGTARAVFMHEVGAHLGMENMLGDQYDAMVDRIVGWAGQGGKTLESSLAVKALERVKSAQVSDEQANSELVAYFIEEAVNAGVTPTSVRESGPVAAFLRQVLQAFKNALAKLLAVDTSKLTAQDMVDIAYGAAKIELAGGIDRVMAGKPAQMSVKAGVPTLDALPGAVSDFLTTAKDAGTWVGTRTMFTEDLIAKAAKAMPSARAYKTAMDKVAVEQGAAERRVADVLQAFRRLVAHEQGTGPASVNAVLQESTMNKAWAFEPAWLPSGSVQVDAKLAERFNALSVSGQAVVRQVFQHGHTTLQELKRAVTDNVKSEFDVQIAEYRRQGNEAEAAKLEAEKAKQLTDFQSLLAQRENWPYAPLKRFGSHVVLATSKRYQDLYTAWKGGDAAALKQMQGLQNDGDHYHVEFMETKRSARRRAEELAGKYDGGYVESFEKLPEDNMLYGGRDMLSAFQRLRGAVQESSDGTQSVDAEVQAKMQGLMRQLYLTLLAENSARKGEIHRKNVAGADKDMMRAFATQGRANAHFLAGLKTNGAINDNLRSMKEEAGEHRTGRAQRQELFNEILRRHTGHLEYSPSPLIDKAMGFSSVWLLLTNPSYYLVNALQPWMMTQPMLAGRHGYGKSASAMMKAYTEVAPLLKDGAITEEDYGKLPADVRQAVEELANQGKIDISMDSELGRFESPSDSPLRHFDWAVGKMQRATQTVEAVNRLSSAVAAYRLEKERTGSHEAAVAYAGKVIYETHGDYTGFNAPRFMRKGVMRLATQFRKFQLVQLSMFARLLNQAFKGASAEERAAGRAALAFNLTHLGVMGGAMGLPGFAAIAWVMGKVFGDDDEPNNPEATLRRVVGDKDLADLLLKGAPKLAGVDISGRVGAGGMLSLLPYTNMEASRKGYYEMLAGAMGPLLGGVMPKMFDAAGLMSKGDYWKGLEAAMPSGLANLAKGARFSTEGVTQRNGDTLLTPDEITFLDGIAQAVGLPSNKISDRGFMAAAQSDADKFYKDKTSEIKRAYADAYLANDSEGTREARQEWQESQEARKRLGFKPQPLSELLKAPQERRKREAQVKSGVATRENNAGFVDALQ